MPLIIPKTLPAYKALQDENIFSMPHARAISQDIRPLDIVVVNLMPNKIETETQLARLLANSPLQVQLTLLRTESHESTHTSSEHLAAFYQTLDEIQQKRYDGMIVTGAPVEHLDYEQIDYWDELVQMFEFSKTNVYSTIYVCWGALAGLYYHYGIPKVMLPKKLSGVYEHEVVRPSNPLMRGFDDSFWAPHSRNASIDPAEVAKHKRLRVLAKSEEAGLHIMSTDHGREIYILGHMEYDKDTLKNEYLRDMARGLDPDIPENYFTNNDPDGEALLRWRGHASLLYMNWLNYYVYQGTPYNLAELQSETGGKG